METSLKRSLCARCGGRGDWSPVFHTPRNWKDTDPIVGEGMPRSGNKRAGYGGTKGRSGMGEKTWNRGKGAQAHHTEAEASGGEDRDRASGAKKRARRKKEVKSREKLSGLAGVQLVRGRQWKGEVKAIIEVSLSESSETPGNLLRFSLPITNSRSTSYTPTTTPSPTGTSTPAGTPTPHWHHQPHWHPAAYTL